MRIPPRPGIAQVGVPERPGNRVNAALELIEWPERHFLRKGQNILKMSSYWPVWICPYGTHQTAPLHETTALQTGAHSLVGPGAGAEMSVAHDPSLDQVCGGRKATGVLQHRLDDLRGVTS